MVNPNPFQNQNIPLAKVMQLRSQGTPNNQIIQTLQNDGYNSDQIFEAMNQADLQQNVGQGMSEPNVEPDNIENNMQMQPNSVSQQFPSMEQHMSNSFNDANRSVIEETTEAIINEKWKELMSNVQKINTWKDSMEHKMTVMENNFKNLQLNFDKLHHAIIGKIGEYDQNIINVGTEIKAMEKVFQKILPTFTENVSELSRITSKMHKNP
jgi:prophage DNA circulation protein